MSARGVAVDDLATVREMVARAEPSEHLAPVGIREVVTGDGAIAMLPEVLGRLDVARGSSVAVLTDDVPKAYAGRTVLDAVTASVSTGWAPTLVELSSGAGGELHADEPTVAEAVRAVGACAAAALVSVGSGTIADLGKAVAQRLELRHVVVQTAASVNGFSDDQSVLLVNGTKRTTPSRWPDAVVVDSRVLVESPAALTRAGLGDLLSTYTGAADWYLASAVGIDTSYSPTAVAVLRSGIDAALGNARGLRTNEPAALQSLVSALTHGGLAMGVAGRTSPSSGAEHTISHLLEMSATALHRGSAHHGAQVGAAVVVMARVWAAMRERLRAGDCVVRPLDAAALRTRVHGAFTHLDRTGAMARECWSAYERKLRWVNDNVEQIQRVVDDWGAHEAAVGSLLADPETLVSTLTAAGAPAALAELDPAPARGTARWAVQNCHLMRDRFTIVDLAELTGWWTERDVDAVLSGRAAQTGDVVIQAAVR